MGKHFDIKFKEKDVHGLIIHSNQRFQYTSFEYKAICESKKNKIKTD